MKKNSKETAVVEDVDETKTEQEVDSELDDDIEVNDPGDCIGHWTECTECEMCEIQDSCRDMTNAIQSKEEKSNGDKE